MENRFQSIEELMKYVETEAWKRAKRLLDKNNVPLSPTNDVKLMREI